MRFVKGAQNLKVFMTQREIKGSFSQVFGLLVR